MSQLEMRPRAHIHTFINTYIHTHENNSENRGRNLSGNDFNIETRAYLSQRSAARDVKYSARARRDAAEIENSRNAQNSRPLPSFYSSREKRDAAAGVIRFSSIHSRGVVSSREVLS